MPAVECPKCAAILKAPAKYKGRKVKYKKCGKSFVLGFVSLPCIMIAAVPVLALAVD